MLNKQEKQTDDSASEALEAIGSQIRRLRTQHSLTLETLGQKTGLSASMLSLVERGMASPSIGSLVAIASALDVRMSDLISPRSEQAMDPVSRLKDQPTFHSDLGAERRILRDDRVRGMEVAINSYEPGTASAANMLHHDGYECGIVIQGKLDVELEGVMYKLRRGDLISYESTRPHRISNTSGRLARALWINLDR